MSSAGVGALVGSGRDVFGYLCLQDLLQHSLYDLFEESRIVQQDILHQFPIHPTMICGHRSLRAR
jgi:hypothetical protein